MKRQYCYIKEVLNFGVNSRGKPLTIFPFEKLVICRTFNNYTVVKKTGRGNKREMMINNAAHEIEIITSLYL